MSVAQRLRTPAFEARRRELPTMYELPSEDPQEPGLPDEFHLHQPQLLSETFRPPQLDPSTLFCASDLNLYYDPDHLLWHKRPDWFAVVGTSRLYEGRDLRDSFVVWHEPALPFLIVELLSPGTEAEDLGRRAAPDTSRSEAPPTKWRVYEELLQIPYYVTYSRHSGELHLFRWSNGRYRAQSPEDGRLWMPEIQLGLGLWRGMFKGLERDWLCFYNAQGWLPSLEAQAEAARRQVEQERQRAAQARQQAEQERRRAEELAAKLRALGIDPDGL